MKAGIVGASGYTGAELLRLLAGHPAVEVAVATAHSHAGELVGEHTPSLAAAYPGLVYEDTGPGPLLDGLDLVFCALPHGESQRIVPDLRGGWGGSWTSPPTSGSGTHRSTRPGTARSTARRRCCPRPSTACPSCSGTAWPGPPWSPRRVATRRRPGWRWRLWSAAGCGGAAGSSSTPRRACRAPGAAPRSRCTSARSTRISSPTGCSPTATPPRWSRSWAPRCSSPPTSPPWSAASWPPATPVPWPATRRRRAR